MHWLQQAKTPKTNGKDGGLEKQKRQISETIPLESSNKTNGIVERNQWIC